MKRWLLALALIAACGDSSGPSSEPDVCYGYMILEDEAGYTYVIWAEFIPCASIGTRWHQAPKPEWWPSS